MIILKIIIVKKIINVHSRPVGTQQIPVLGVLQPNSNDNPERSTTQRREETKDKTM